MDQQSRTTRDQRQQPSQEEPQDGHSESTGTCLPSLHVCGCTHKYPHSPVPLLHPPARAEARAEKCTSVLHCEHTETHAHKLRHVLTSNTLVLHLEPFLHSKTHPLVHSGIIYKMYAQRHPHPPQRASSAHHFSPRYTQTHIYKEKCVLRLTCVLTGTPQHAYTQTRIGTSES